MGKDWRAAVTVITSDAFLEWVNSFPGVVDVAVEGECPTRLRVELSTEDRTILFALTLRLTDRDFFRATPTTVIVDDWD